MSQQEITADELNESPDDLDFEDDFEDDDFAEEVTLTPERTQSQAPPLPKEESVSAMNSKKNTLIMIGVTAFLIICGGAFIFWPSSAPQQSVRNASELLPPVNNMTGQQPTQQRFNNTGSQPVNTFQQSYQNQGSVSQVVQQQTTSPPAQQYPPQAVQNPNGNRVSIGQQFYNQSAQKPVAYSQVPNTPPGQYPQSQQSGQYPQGQQSGAGVVTAPQPLAIAGQPDPGQPGMLNQNQAKRPTAVKERDPEVLKTLTKLHRIMKRMVADQNSLLKEVREVAQEKPKDDGKTIQLTKELETARDEAADHVSKIADLKKQIKELKGKNTYLRNLEREWRYKVKALETRLNFGPQKQAVLTKFKSKWSLSGMGPGVAVFISQTGDLREVQAGDKIDGLMINSISYANKRIETSAGRILYQ